MKGSSMVLIVFLVLYLLAIGYLANAMGYTRTDIGDLSSWTVPYVGSIPVLGAIFDALAYVVGAIASFFVLLGFSISGNGGLPIWLTMFGLTPFFFGLGWILLELIRG